MRTLRARQNAARPAVPILSSESLPTASLSQTPSGSVFSIFRRLLVAIAATTLAIGPAAAKTAAPEILIGKIKIVSHHFLQLRLLFGCEDIDHFLACVRLQLTDLGLQLFLN